MKAVTFSFDDGNESDIRLIELFNKYGLKCSFNLNSGLIGKNDEWIFKSKTIEGKEFLVKKLCPFKEEYYEGHEICVHGLYHRGAIELSDSDLEEEFVLDKKQLSERFNQDIVGMAYAYGAYDERVIECIKRAGLKYGRGVVPSYDFSKQENMYEFKPTCHFMDDRAYEMIEKFLAIEEDGDYLLYIWGHSYECDGEDSWDRIENMMKMLSNREDIFYGNNTEVFEQLHMI